MLSSSGFSESQTDSLISSFVITDDAPPSTAEVKLEIVTALQPVVNTLSDIIKSISDAASKQDSIAKDLANKQEATVKELANRINTMTALLVLLDLAGFP